MYSTVQCHTKSRIRDEWLERDGGGVAAEWRGGRAGVDGAALGPSGGDGMGRHDRGTRPPTYARARPMVTAGWGGGGAL
jgi:hypothetical protein